jgi:hypothetical protein
MEQKQDFNEEPQPTDLVAPSQAWGISETRNKEIEEAAAEKGNRPSCQSGRQGAMMTIQVMASVLQQRQSSEAEQGRSSANKKGRRTNQDEQCLLAC